MYHCSTHNSQITVNNYAQCYKCSLLVVHVCKTWNTMHAEHHADLVCLGYHANMHVRPCHTCTNAMHVITVTSCMPQCILRGMWYLVHLCMYVCLSYEFRQHLHNTIFIQIQRYFTLLELQ